MLYATKTTFKEKHVDNSGVQNMFFYLIFKAVFLMNHCNFSNKSQ